MGLVVACVCLFQLVLFCRRGVIVVIVVVVAGVFWFVAFATRCLFFLLSCTFLGPCSFSMCLCVFVDCVAVRCQLFQMSSLIFVFL